MAYRAHDSWSNDTDYLTDLGLQIQSKIRDSNARGRPSHLTREISELISEFDKGVTSLRPLASHRSLSERERSERRQKLHELNDRLREFNRSQVLDFNPYDNGDNVQSHSTGTGPGLGQRLSIDDIREQQKSIIAEQDRGLEQISSALRRQQKMGYAIQDEVGEHNVLIDDIGARTTRADARIQRETQRIEETRRKEKTYCTCTLWIIIVVLAVVIVIIGVVPGKK